MTNPTPCTVHRRDRQWFIRDPQDGEYGPYDTKAEAVEDARGVDRFYRLNPKYRKEMTNGLSGM
jgi:hypothetical protein